VAGPTTPRRRSGSAISQVGDVAAARHLERRTCVGVLFRRPMREYGLDSFGYSSVEMNCREAIARPIVPTAHQRPQGPRCRATGLRA
jgi:hypothetical protein